MSTPSLGSHLLASRLEGRSQTEIAKRVGVHQSTLSRWASGKQRPDVPTAIRVRDELEIPVEAWCSPPPAGAEEAAA
jgi:transcriptional regulator with XRE-family HTH domain